MEPFEFKFGTPRPVRFRETFGTNRYDFDLEARCAGSITVTEYDTEKYGEPEALRLKIKEEMPEILAQCLEEMAPRSVMMRIYRKNGPLNDVIAKKLSEAGVKANVEIVNFVLTEESQELYDEKEKLFHKEFLQDISVDRTDRPCTDWPRKYVSDCVPQGLRDEPPKDLTGILFAYKKDEFCRNCGAKRVEDAEFCTECGTRFKYLNQ